ncbi:MAG: aminodeoxychorismate synthase component I [Deltaproteobacteria bacterium]|nr:aminodeoxychorismate synthase component I [Deltaproteobacteria bacterium]
MPTQELRLACTPLDLLAGGQSRPFLFDGAGPDSWGSGFAIFGHNPSATLRVDAAGVAQWSDGQQHRDLHSDPLAQLERFCAAHAARTRDAPPLPFAGGLVAMLSYDLKDRIERLPSLARDDQQLPVLDCAAYDWALLYDYRTRSWLLTSAFLSDDALNAVGRAITQQTRVGAPPAAVPTVVTSNFTRAAYVAAVRRALAYIAAGDIYQVNLAQRFMAAAAIRLAPQLFARLQAQHPMPYAAYLDCDDFAVVSNSPECFLQLTPESITTWPIKGTRARGCDNVADVASAQALRASVKDGAEHVMIVDLERNDLGRLCQAGSVTVGSFAAVQSFPTLHHLVSEIHGRLQPGTSFADILRATFPGGSITGAPKIRAMEIIDELEPVRRGVYTGAIGFLDAQGRGTFNIAIRTAVARAGQLTYHAGGAVVADSDPDGEYEETLLKARAFFAACGVSGPA